MKIFLITTKPGTNEQPFEDMKADFGFNNSEFIECVFADENKSELTALAENITLLDNADGVFFGKNCAEDNACNFIREIAEHYNIAIYK